MRRELGKDARLRPALEAFPGLRILKQDPWECLCAFLTSIASNIPRITRNVADMARAFGRDLGGGLRSFPEPAGMGDEASLRALGLGFRARYLEQAARLARGGLLDEIALMDDADAKSALMVLPGVGEKVADCILLFAYGRLGAFPVDTWIRQLMRERFFRGRRVPDARIRSYARDRWGAWAGYAQQHLYHWGRTLRA
jgi:N-glycosylase/DNA lyase